MNEVLDITKRLSRSRSTRRDGEPAPVLSLVSSLADRAPRFSVHTPEDIGLDDGLVHLIHRHGDVETRFSLHPSDAHALARSVLDTAVAVQARADQNVVLRWETRRRGVDLPEVRPPVVCQILDRRGDSVLLSRIDTHDQAWFSVRTGLPVLSSPREHLRIIARDRRHLQHTQAP